MKRKDGGYIEEGNSGEPVKRLHVKRGVTADGVFDNETPAIGIDAQTPASGRLQLFRFDPLVGSIPELSKF
jgi:hypothetical protein